VRGNSFVPLIPSLIALQNSTLERFEPSGLAFCHGDGKPARFHRGKPEEPAAAIFLLDKNTEGRAWPRRSSSKDERRSWGPTDSQTPHADSFRLAAFSALCQHWRAMSWTRKRLLVVGLLAIALAGLALIPRASQVSINLLSYKTNDHGIVWAVALLSNSGPRGVFPVIQIGVGSGPYQPLFGYDNSPLVRLGSNATHFIESPTNSRIVATYFLDYQAFEPDTIGKQLRFLVDHYLLRRDRRTNMYTVRFDVP